MLSFNICSAKVAFTAIDDTFELCWIQINIRCAGILIATSNMCFCWCCAVSVTARLVRTQAYDFKRVRQLAKQTVSRNNKVNYIFRQFHGFIASAQFHSSLRAIRCARIKAFLCIQHYPLVNSSLGDIDLVIHSFGVMKKEKKKQTDGFSHHYIVNCSAFYTIYPAN